MSNDSLISEDALPAHGAYRHRGTRAIQRMVEYAPATGGLALWVRHADRIAGDEAADSPPVSTDGLTLWYGKAFETLPIAEQAGLVAHEVLHIALRHPQRYQELQAQRGDVDLRLFNLCADAIVNSTLSHLSWLSLPESAIGLDTLLANALGIRQSVERSLLEWDVEKLYRAIDDRRAPEQRGSRQEETDHSRSRQGGQSGREPSRPQPEAGGDKPARERPDGPRSASARALGQRAHADLAPSPETRGEPEAQAEQAREWSERLLRGHAGDGAHSMLRTLIADLPRTRTPWEQILRRRLAHSLSPRSDLSWSRPSRSYLANQGRLGPHRRLPWEPGFSQSRAVPRLVVIVDVSGSIDESLMTRFAREIEAITRRLESGLTLIVGDAEVREVKHFEPGRADLGEIVFLGGGGTDFTPMLEEAARHRPDIVVVLTDLEGPARIRPPWPVIWAVPEDHAANPEPFGRKLILA